MADAEAVAQRCADAEARAAAAEGRVPALEGRAAQSEARAAAADAAAASARERCLGLEAQVADSRDRVAGAEARAAAAEAAAAAAARELEEQTDMGACLAASRDFALGEAQGRVRRLVPPPRPTFCASNVHALPSQGSWDTGP